MYGQRTWRGVWAFAVWMGLGYLVMNALSKIHLQHDAACEVLMASSNACRSLGSSWEVVAIAANVGCIAIAVLAWFFAPFSDGNMKADEAAKAARQPKAD